MSSPPGILPRLAASALANAAAVMPAVVVMGARQAGKSTLVRTAQDVADRAYVTLDNLEALVQARTAPDDLVQRASRITIDEVQRDPDLLLAVKRAIDEEHPRRPGRFLLTGSANLLLMKRVSESLAGRATYVTLWPLTRRERLGLGACGIWNELLRTPVKGWYDLVLSQTAMQEDWRDRARIGGYPTPAYELESADARSIWFRGYIQTYLERDLQDLAAIDNLVDFQRTMRAASLRLGAVVNQAELARDTGIPRPTVYRYMNLLETSFQVVRIEAYSVNRTKRLVKSPKLYWSDTGLALHLSGEDGPRGAHLENLVLGDLLAWRDAQAPEAHVLFWRTQEGEEVDLVIEAGDRLLPIEVKAARGVRSDDVRAMKTFRQQYGDAAPGGLVLHAGEEVFWISQGILAVPWWRVI